MICVPYHASQTMSVSEALSVSAWLDAPAMISCACVNKVFNIVQGLDVFWQQLCRARWTDKQNHRLTAKFEASLDNHPQYADADCGWRCAVATG